MAEDPPTPDEEKEDKLPDSPEEIENAPPRFKVERIPDVFVQQEFQQWDEETGRMVTKARGTSRHFSMGHNFLVHLEHGRKFQQAKDANDAIKWLLKKDIFTMLVKEGINPDLEGPELGIIRISVPRFCQADEAMARVFSAITKMVETFGQKEKKED